jgi:hypothetical protein
MAVIMSVRDRPVAKATPAMVKAGEAVLDRACEAAEIWPPSYCVISAAAEVYAAMDLARLRDAPSATEGEVPCGRCIDEE